MEKKAIRRITAEKRERINRLSNILYNFLPLNSWSKSTVTFISIFKESHISDYLAGPTNKKQALQKGLSLLYRYHERLPKQIIRKIIPAAIEYRKYNRNPLTRHELDSISDCLISLGIDMSKEIKMVTLDDSLPQIQVPPSKLVEYLLTYDLHRAIATEPFLLFQNGHFNEAVRKGFERFEDAVREVSSLPNIGRDLMAKAFSNDTHINLDGVKPENAADFADGYKLLSMGAMAAIRNIFSHGDEERRKPEECFEMLLFLNWLFRFIVPNNDDAETKD